MQNALLVDEFIDRTRHLGESSWQLEAKHEAATMEQVQILWPTVQSMSAEYSENHFRMHTRVAGESTGDHDKAKANTQQTTNETSTARAIRHRMTTMTAIARRVRCNATQRKLSFTTAKAADMQRLAVYTFALTHEHHAEHYGERRMVCALEGGLTEDYKVEYTTGLYQTYSTLPRLQKAMHAALIVVEGSIACSCASHNITKCLI